jgi:hypothetical protein
MFAVFVNLPVEPSRPSHLFTVGQLAGFAFCLLMMVALAWLLSFSWWLVLCALAAAYTLLRWVLKHTEDGAGGLMYLLVVNFRRRYGDG